MPQPLHSDTQEKAAKPPILAPPIKHVGIIMDGNGRWAKERGLPRIEGHRAGTRNIRPVVEAFARRGISHLTLFAFSTENWSRPDWEIKGLMQVLGEAIDQETEEFHRHGVRLCHLGHLDKLAPALRDKVRRALELTKNNTGLSLSIAFNYGGRTEILDAIRSVIRDHIPPEAVDEALISRYLYTNGQPDPDIIIRTGGELRLSNFLLWQSAYSEIYCTPTYWPDFNEEEIERALENYRSRERRFGGRPSE